MKGKRETYETKYLKVWVGTEWKGKKILLWLDLSLSFDKLLGTCECVTYSVNTTRQVRRGRSTLKLNQAK